MYYEAESKRFAELIEATPGDSIMGYIHDRTDPDALGWTVLMNRVLKDHFNRSFCCFYSKKVAFMMNRNIVKNFVPAGVLIRVEENRELLKEWQDKAPLVVVGDCSSASIVTGLAKYLRSDEGAQKQVLVMDHHEKSDNDLEDLPNVTALRVEGSQSTSSLMLHIMRNLGVELDGDDEGQLRTAVATKLGIEVDLIGYDEDKIAPSVVESLEYLDKVIGDKGQALVKKLRQIKIPRRWYTHLARAMSQVPQYNQNLAVCGLGVLSDNGILPFVANELMGTGYFESVMVFGIVYDQLGQRFVDIDLDASGRSRNNPDISMPDLFGKVFYYTDELGRKVSRGGGRSNEILGDYAGAGASVPLKYWIDMTSFGVDKLKRLLVDHAWPVEFERTRIHLLENHDIKADHILDVSPKPGEPTDFGDDAA